VAQAVEAAGVSELFKEIVNKTSVLIVEILIKTFTFKSDFSV